MNILRSNNFINANCRNPSPFLGRRRLMYFPICFGLIRLKLNSENFRQNMKGAHQFDNEAEMIA
jgi:hypothetical protein